MSETRTLDQVSHDIHRQRLELAAALATVRHDVRVSLARQVPRVALGAAVLLGVLAVRQLTRRSRPATQTEWLRFGRFALVEREP